MRDIVLVHSDEKLSDIYSRRLRNDFSVHRAVDGISGLRLVKKVSPHLLVAQDDLPYLSGLGLLRYMRQTPKFASTPVVILSKNHPSPDALTLGANDWIKIPGTSVDELINKVIYHLLTNKVIR